MRLGTAIRILLCGVEYHRYVSGLRKCSCDDPLPRTYRCVYGDCEIIRCGHCNRVINWRRGECHFPYQQPT